MRLLMITATALALGSAAMTGTAQAAVTGPAGTMQQSSQSLDLTQQARRICRPVLRCGKFPQGCWWTQSCYITLDYPPEHGRR
jgi:hypothetical protein